MPRLTPYERELRFKNRLEELERMADSGWPMHPSDRTMLWRMRKRRDHPTLRQQKYGRIPGRLPKHQEDDLRFGEEALRAHKTVKGILDSVLTELTLESVRKKSTD